MMPFNSFRFKELSSYLAKYIANCEDKWHLLPRTRTQPLLSTVYCLLDSTTNRIWYIGHSKNLMRRILQHKQNPKIAKKPWDTVAHLEPGITSLHVRLQVEGILQVAVVPTMRVGQFAPL